MSSIQATELDNYQSAAPLHSASVILSIATAQVKKGGPPDGSIGLYMVALLQQRHVTCSRHLDLSAAGGGLVTGIAFTHAPGLTAAQFEGVVEWMRHSLVARNGSIRRYARPQRLHWRLYVGIKEVNERITGDYPNMLSEGSNTALLYDMSKVAVELDDVRHTSRICLKIDIGVGGVMGLGPLEDSCSVLLTHDGRPNEMHPSGWPVGGDDRWAPHGTPLSNTRSRIWAA
ncbi:hypothetical protein F4861DRAFT_536593 [Xylaria intraflava]|nr:hypothetical protein F4861DRAFT_536593 [Xylaria intraflava]